MSLDALDYLAAGGATLVAGAVNAMAGGGSLISFPTLIAIGVPPLPANITNTVALCPGYLSGMLAQRADLEGQRRRVAWLAVAAGLGGLTGSALLEVTSEATFRVVVPWLLILSCVLLLAQDRVRSWVLAKVGAGADGQHGDGRPPSPLVAAIFAGAVYGGFFGAGLGILLLAFLGLFLAETMIRINAAKQVLQSAINVLAAVFFAFSGHVRWELVPVMAVTAVVGGTLGSRLTRLVDPTWLRRAVVLIGLGVAIDLLVTR